MEDDKCAPGVISQGESVISQVLSLFFFFRRFYNLEMSLLFIINSCKICQDKNS